VGGKSYNKATKKGNTMKNLEMINALITGEVVCDTNVTGLERYGLSKSVRCIVLRTENNLPTNNGGFISGLNIYHAAVDTVVGKNRIPVEAGTVVALVSTTFYPLFSTRDGRNLMLNYGILRSIFAAYGYHNSAVPTGNIDAAACHFLITVNGEKPSNICKALKRCNKRAAEDCLHYMKNVVKAVNAMPITNAEALDALVDDTAPTATAELIDDTIADAFVEAPAC
jgi:hypothetical protein